MGRTLDVAPLNLIGGLGAENINREGDFEQDMPLTPVDGRIEVELGAVIGQRDTLGIVTIQNAPPYLQRGPQGTGFGYLYRRCRIGRPHLIIVKDIYIPGIPVHWPIFEGLELVGDVPRGQYLSLVGLVVNTGNITLTIQFHPQVIIFQQGGGGFQAGIEDGGLTGTDNQSCDAEGG